MELTNEQKAKFDEDRKKISAMFASDHAVQRRSIARSLDAKSAEDADRHDGPVPINHGQQSTDEPVKSHARSANANDSLNERVAELEIRVFKLWDLLTEKSHQTGKPKLSKSGRNIVELLKSRHN